MLAWRKSLGKYGLVKSDCEIPMIKDDEVLVRVLATGICGTDFGIYKGYREVEEGLIPGHEFIGEIVKLGSSVTGYGSCSTKYCKKMWQVSGLHSGIRSTV